MFLEHKHELLVNELQVQLNSSTEVIVPPLFLTIVSSLSKIEFKSIYIMIKTHAK